MGTPPAKKGRSIRNREAGYKYGFTKCNCSKHTSERPGPEGSVGKKISTDDRADLFEGMQASGTVARLLYSG